MLDDRSYMREGGFEPRKPLALILIIVNAAIFLVQVLLPLVFPNFESFVTNYLTLSLGGIRHWYLWQFFTFQFLHAGFLHLLFNCLGIYMLGRSVEEAIGRTQFLQLYLISGALGGLVHVAGSAVWPQHFGQHVVGASAGVFGIVAAFAALFPDQRLTMLLFLILPVTITARVLLIGSAFAELVWMVTAPGQVAHGAHLGGMAAGLAYVHWVVRSDWTWVRLRWPKFHRAERPRELVGTPTSRASWQRASSVAEDVPSAEFISREVDPILDKISAHGIQSLTDRERKILEAARAKMAKR